MTDKMRMKQYTLGPVQTNCYIMVNSKTKECVIFDPGDQGEALSYKIKEDDLKPVAILLTHGHFDHICAVNYVKKVFGIEVYVQEGDLDMVSDPEINDSISFTGKGVSVNADKVLKGGEVLNLAGFDIEVIHTPGHSPGSTCYYIKDENLLISGDTLFQMSVGRTDLHGGSMSTLIKSLEEKLMVLPDDTDVLPGHGEATTIRVEKKYNPFL